MLNVTKNPILSFLQKFLNLFSLIDEDFYSKIVVKCREIWGSNATWYRLFSPFFWIKFLFPPPNLTLPTTHP